MHSRFVAALAALMLAGTLAACSSGAGASGASGADAEQSAVPGSGSGAAEPADDHGDEPAAADAAGKGPACDVLLQFHQDITGLLDDAPIGEADADAILGPVTAMKDDLPGMVGTVLPILKHDLQAAQVMEGEELAEYFERGTRATAIDELVSSTRQACELPDTWPEAS